MKNKTSCLSPGPGACREQRGKPCLSVPDSRPGHTKAGTTFPVHSLGAQRAGVLNGTRQRKHHEDTLFADTRQNHKAVTGQSQRKHLDRPERQDCTFTVSLRRCADAAVKTDRENACTHTSARHAQQACLGSQRCGNAHKNGRRWIPPLARETHARTESTDSSPTSIGPEGHTR